MSHFTGQQLCATFESQHSNTTYFHEGNLIGMQLYLSVSMNWRARHTTGRRLSQAQCCHTSNNNPTSVLDTRTWMQVRHQLSSLQNNAQRNQHSWIPSQTTSRLWKQWSNPPMLQSNNGRAFFGLPFNENPTSLGPLLGLQQQTWRCWTNRRCQERLDLHNTTSSSQLRQPTGRSSRYYATLGNRTPTCYRQSQQGNFSNVLHTDTLGGSLWNHSVTQQRSTLPQKTWGKESHLEGHLHQCHQHPTSWILWQQRASIWSLPLHQIYRSQRADILSSVVFYFKGSTTEETHHSKIGIVCCCTPS